MVLASRNTSRDDTRAGYFQKVRVSNTSLLKDDKQQEPIRPSYSFSLVNTRMILNEEATLQYLNFVVEVVQGSFTHKRIPSRLMESG